MQILIESSVRIVLLAAAVAAVMKLLRIASPRVRHAAWAGVSLVMLLMPVVVASGPLAQVPLLPLRLEAAVPPSATSDVAIGAAVGAPNVMTTPAPVRAVTWPPVMGLAYLTGVAMMLVRLAMGVARARRLIRGATRVGGRWTSTKCVSPVTVGLTAPVVILPAGWWSWPAAELGAVLAHEHEHVRRRDPLIAFVVLLNRAVFWFHPLAWWLPRHVSRLAEEACDAVVVSQGHDTGVYRRTLVRFARATANARVRLSALGTAMPGSALAARLRLLERGPAPAPSPAKLVATAAGYVMAVVVCAGVSLIPIAPSIAMARSVAQADAAALNLHDSDHFEIHFARPLESLVPDIQRDAEDAYLRVSAALKYDLRERVPLLVVPTNGDIAGSAQDGDVAARAALGRHRIVLSVEAWKARPRLIVHELTHHFLFEILPAITQSDPWLSEGLAEHLRGEWSEADARRTRAAVAGGRLPALDGLSAADGYWGHALFDFVASQYGDEGLRRFLFALRKTPKPSDAVRPAFGTTADEFVRSLRAYVITRFGPA